MAEKIYLVYRNVNGKLTACKEYGDHTTGENKKKGNYLKKIELQGMENSLNIAKLQEIYPYEKQA